MLSTSQDLLYLVGALCLLWLTVFLCWVLYQAARALRNANVIMESVAHKLELIAGAVEFIRRKMDHVTGTMGTVASMLAGLVEKMVASKISSAFEKRSAGRSSKSKRSSPPDEKNGETES